MSPQPDTKHKHHSVLPYRLAQTTSFYILLQPLRTSYFKASFSLAPACSLFLPGHDTILALYLYDEALEFQKYACYFQVFQITLIHHLIWKAFQWRERRKLRDMHSTLQEYYVTIKSMSILKMFFKPVPLTECLVNVHF